MDDGIHDALSNREDRVVVFVDSLELAGDKIGAQGVCNTEKRLRLFSLLEDRSCAIEAVDQFGHGIVIEGRAS